MSKNYSQSRALWAITKASFKAIFNQPVSMLFGLLFPIIFILILGAFGRNGAPVYQITMDKNADTSNIFFDAIKANPSLRIVYYTDSAALQKNLQRGRLTAVVNIRVERDSSGKPHFSINAFSTTASNNTLPALQQILEHTRLKVDAVLSGNRVEHVTILPMQIKETRAYRQIDFILPGQIGFSILFATLFGIAFTFFTLREELVLKRFYASPVSRINILLGIGMSRLFFQLLNVVVLVLFGYFFLHFTLQHGAITLLEIILLSIVMLFLLMGVGLLFSSIAKTDTSIPLLINLFGFPQMLLSGTFFPIGVFPNWLQQICNVLPLSQFNNAMRKISFEGLSIFDCWKEVGILGIWILITYALLSRLIRWQ